MTIYLLIIFVHWIADFLFQTDWQARNKSTDNTALMEHTMTYMAVWIVPAMYLLGFLNGALFCLITLLAHTTTDYFTSRLNTKLWKEGKVHWFFVSVGFDQVLHYVQLFLTYQLLLHG